MTKLRKVSTLAALLTLGAAGCVDLGITNENAPDADRALATAGDVESLIGGAYRQWWNSEYSSNSVGPLLSAQSFQHNASWANFAMHDYTYPPRPSVYNDPAHGNYRQHANPWAWNYRAISASADGLRAIESGRVEYSPEDEARAKAFAHFTMGLAQASLAVLFDQAFIVDETTDITVPQELKPYKDVLAAALTNLDEAATLAQGTSFTLPETWMSKPLTSAELARLARSYKARYRAAVARNPTERKAVDWNAVVADANAGITADFSMKLDNVNWYAYGSPWYNNANDGTWAQLPYFVYGMADQSGRYQRWLAYPLADRFANLGNSSADPFIIVTPDTRFPQGATLAEQQNNKGKYIVAAKKTGMWGRPDRGTWRWSWYLPNRFELWMSGFAANPDFKWVTLEEMRLLKAEAAYQTGDKAGAAALINVTRTANGLSATDAAGTNTSCVPKLPNGQCGDLWEMLKWEKRMEVGGYGLFAAPWYFDSRGWGDLYYRTELEFPMPCKEAQVLLMSCYTLGGDQPSASPGSSYNYNGEK